MTQICNYPQNQAEGCKPLAACFSPKLFKALCDPNRLTILSSLAAAGGPLPVGDIATCCPTDVSVVSRHLAMLREAGIVEATRRGRHVLYGVRYTALAATLREMADAVEACCPGE